MVSVRILQALRASIHNQRELEADANTFQTQLAHFHVLLPTADLLSCSNPDIVREALALLVASLHGGNVEAQKTFLQHFMGTREETFFVDVSERIKSAMEKIKEVCYYVL